MPFVVPRHDLLQLFDGLRMSSRAPDLDKSRREAMSAFVTKRKEEGGAPLDRR
jgi:hypothetical protein